MSITGMKPAFNWAHLNNELPWTIVCINRAGYGASTMVQKPSSWTYAMFAADALDVLDTLGVHAFALGMSSGGMYAIAVAALAPERVSALGLIPADANYGPGFPKGTKMNAPAPDDASLVTYMDGTDRAARAAAQAAAHRAAQRVLQPTYTWRSAPLASSWLACNVQSIIHGAKDDTTDVNCARFHAHVFGQKAHHHRPGWWAWRDTVVFLRRLRGPAAGV
jgi:pimeloyl-ACP methyl ester carboxylesterase